MFKTVAQLASSPAVTQTGECCYMTFCSERLVQQKEKKLTELTMN